MAANLLGRYVWLMDILRRHKRLTFEEINELWQVIVDVFAFNEAL